MSYSEELQKELNKISENVIKEVEERFDVKRRNRNIDPLKIVAPIAVVFILAILCILIIPYTINNYWYENPVTSLKENHWYVEGCIDDTLYCVLEPFIIVSSDSNFKSDKFSPFIYKCIPTCEELFVFNETDWVKSCSETWDGYWMFNRTLYNENTVPDMIQELPAMYDLVYRCISPDCSEEPSILRDLTYRCYGDDCNVPLTTQCDNSLRENKL